MTIKKTGGIFGRNPTFNDVDVDGTLTVGGNAVPDASTILVDGDIGSTVQGYDATILTSSDIGSTVEAYDATILKSADIGSTVQAYDADTTKNDVSNTFTADQIFDEKVAIGHTTAFAPLYIRNNSDTDYNPASAAFNSIATFANTTSGTLNNALISFSTESNGEWYIGGVQNSGNTAADFILASRNAGARAERVRILASGGITFNGDTAAANALDDYEEGTWTGTLIGVTTAGLSPTATGNYTKVGDRVHAYIAFSAVDTTGATGNIRVTGLPFTSSSSAIGTCYNSRGPASITIANVPTSNTFINQINYIGSSQDWASSGTTYAAFAVTYKA